MATLPRVGAHKQSSADTCNSIFRTKRRFSNSSNFVNDKNRVVTVRSPAEKGSSGNSLTAIRNRLSRVRSLPILSQEEKKREKASPKKTRLAMLRQIFEPGGSPLRPRLRSYSSPGIPLAPKINVVPSTPKSSGGRRPSEEFSCVLQPLLEDDKMKDEGRLIPDDNGRNPKCQTLPRRRKQSDSEETELLVLDMRVKIRLSKVKQRSSERKDEEAESILPADCESFDCWNMKRGNHPGSMKSSYHSPTPRRSGYHNNRQHYDDPPPPEQDDYHDNQPRYQRHQRPLSDEYQHSEGREDDVFQEERRDQDPSHSSRPIVSSGRLAALDRVQAASAENLLHAGRASDSSSSIEQNQHYPVKLRQRKARDKGPVERPRSWHASKHLDPDSESSYTKHNMRSPAMYGNPAPPYGMSSRKSTEWAESGDLKSVYKGDFNGSKDSLISGGSQISIRSSRYSASSSGSRGSFDNLPNSGLVKQKAIKYEMLTTSGHNLQDHHNQHYGGSREELQRLNRMRRRPSEDFDHHATRDPSKSPSYHNKTNSHHTPSPQRRARGEDSHFKFSDARIVKTPDAGRSQLPDPPQRDSSFEALSHYQKRPNSSHLQDDHRHHQYSSSPEHPASPQYQGLKPPSGQERQPPVGSDYSKPSAQRRSEDFTTKLPSATFGVVGFADSKEIVTRRISPSQNSNKMALSSKPRQATKTSVNPSPATYERLSDCFSVYEPQSSTERVKARHGKTSSYSDTLTSSSGHSRVDSTESNESGERSDSVKAGAGKWGEMWKTPNVHRRAKSFGNLNSVGENNEQNSKLSLSKEKQHSPKSPEQDMNYTTPVSENINQRSIIHSLQQSNHPSTNCVSKRVLSKQKSNSRLEEEEEQKKYTSQIKKMTGNVVRFTSMKYPAGLTEKEKRNLFKSLNQDKPSPAIIHVRTRSHGNEIDESESVGGPTHRSHFGSSAPSRDGLKPRPVSADHSRNRSSSFGSDDSDVTSPIHRTPTTSSKNRRISMDVRPELSPHSVGPLDPRVIDIVSRKSKGSTESSPVGHTHTSSSMSIHTSHSDETDKRQRFQHTLQDERVAKTGSSGDVSYKKKPTSPNHTTPNSGKPQTTQGSVRRLPNFLETRKKFQNPSKQVTEDRHQFNKAPSVGKLSHKADSLENLVDEGIGADSPVRFDDSPSRRHNFRSNLINKREPPVYPKPQKRLSNRSNGSSATTTSSMSNISTTSSTSIERYPTVDEVNEQGSQDLRISSSFPHHHHQDPIVLDLKPLENKASSDRNEPEPRSKPEANEEGKPSFSTDTFVRRGKKPKKVDISVRSSREGDGESGDDEKKSYVTKIELPINRKMPSSLPPPPVEPPKPEMNEKVKGIIEKVKRSSSMKKINPNKQIAPPPAPPAPTGSAKDSVMKTFIDQQKSVPDLPPPPPPPPQIPEKSSDYLSSLSPSSKASFTGESLIKDPATTKIKDVEETPASDPRVGMKTPTTEDTYREVTYILGYSDQERCHGNQEKPSRPSSYENVHTNGGYHYENVFTPVQARRDSKDERTESPPKEPADDVDASTPESKEEEKKIEEVPKLLLPNIGPTSLEQEHPELARDIINNEGDDNLAKLLRIPNFNANSFMGGVLSQPANDIIMEAIKNKINKSGVRVRGGAGGGEESAPSNTSIGKSSRPIPSKNLLVITSNPTSYLQKFRNDIIPEPLPGSSNYYCPVSKAKIMGIVKERIASEGDIGVNLDQEEINKKKTELVLSIKKKLDDLNELKVILEDEMKDNESLGKDVLSLIKQMCTEKEKEKYNIFVQDVDRIINLLLSLSSRLARVENAINMHSPDADRQELDLLKEKRKKLMEQHKEAKALKENIDRRQKAVSETLANYFNHEQFKDYEHYIKMKSALIMEQRELMDKSKLGEDQIQCLRDSLPDDWQSKLDALLGDDDE